MKHLIDIFDLSVQEIDELIEVAKDIRNNPDKYNEALKHKIMGLLFFEPSTRTRLSFESAMLSLGGQTLGFSSASTSSSSKGESVADTIAVVSNYVDIIAMRHPKEGAPIVAEKATNVPIINAGDGGHHHPTQTLTDLLTIYEEKGRLNNLKIGLCGDLKYGRTVHSLIQAMSRYEGIKFYLISPEELKVPNFVIKDYLDKNNIEYEECSSLDNALPELDILYMTRIQQERFASREEYLRLKDSYILTKEKMELAKSDTCVMHPLPRVNEISTEVDSDSRAVYFRQTLYGKFIRMALILKLFNERNQEAKKQDKDVFITDKICSNAHCITGVEQEIKHLAFADENGVARCYYCDKEL